MKIKRKTFLGGIVAALCACTALTFGAVFCGNNNKVSAEAAATGSAPASILSLNGDFASNLQGAQNEYIYFGTNNNAPVKWRVLHNGIDKSSGSNSVIANKNRYGSGILLWADYQLGKEAFNSNNYAFWGTSSIRTSLNGSWYFKLFQSADEKGAVEEASSYTTDGFGMDTSQSQYQFKRDQILASSSGNNGKYSTTTVGNSSLEYAQYSIQTANNGVQEDVEGDYLFLLDYYDINNVNYGFGDDGLTYANKVAQYANGKNTNLYTSATWTADSNYFPGYYDGSGKSANDITSTYLSFSDTSTASYYWLRQPGRRKASDVVGLVVISSGLVGNDLITASYGVRPAFNFDASNVLYATAASVSNSSTFTAVDSVSGKPAYKVYTKAFDDSGKVSYINYNEPSNASGAPTIKTDSTGVTVTKAGQTGKAVILLADKNDTSIVKYQATADFSGGSAKANFPSNVNTGEYAVTVLFMDKANGGTASETVTASYTQSKAIVPAKLTPPSGTVTTTYNGLEQNLFDLTTDKQPNWYNSALYTDPSKIEMDDKVTEAGEHTISVKLLSENYAWSDDTTNTSDTRTFTFKVDKKALEIEFEDKGGVKVAKFKDTNEIYTRDSGDKYPKLITKYSKNNNAGSATYTTPDKTGTWYAHAFLENAETCNYSVDGTGSQFELNKIAVSYPKLSASSSSSEVYNGEEQEFTFEGYDPELMTYEVPAGASFDGETLKVKNAGTYTPVFTLKNNSLYAFSGTAPSVEITAKPVVIVSDSANATTWQRKTKTELEFNVTTPLCSTDSTLKFVASYTLNGSDPVAINGNSIAVNGKTCTVTIGTGFAKGNFILTVSVADGENYVGSVTHSFEITAQGLSLGSNDIKWNIDGKTFIADDYDNGKAVYEMEYTGNPLTLQNVKVDFSSALDAAELVQDGDLTGDFINAVNVGEYEAVFKIKAASNEYTCEDGPFTIIIKIVPKVLDFSGAVWQWQYADDGEEWKPLTDGSMPSFDNKAVAVRVSPDYMLSLGLAADDYGIITYSHNGNLTEKGDKASTATITITNGNYVTDEGGDYIEISKDWKITAKSLSYSWDEKGQTVAGPDDRSFEIPAIVFADGNSYTEYYEYYFTVDDVDGEMTREELEAYLTANWSDTTTVRGRVYVRMKTDASDEFAINSGYRSFTTGTPKTSLGVAVTGSGAEYGKVDFAISVLRGTADESRRTSVTITGGSLTEAQTFDGDDTELVKFINKLGAGSYTVTVSLKTGNEDSYVLSQREFEFEVLKCNVLLPTVREIVFTGETINLIDYLEGFDPALMKLIGAAEGENGIVSGRDYRKSGYFTTIALIDGANYQFVKAAESEAETVKATLKFAVAFADGEEVLGSEYELNWMINRFRITEDMWDKSGKNGVTLKLPAQFAAMLADENLLKISCSYYEDQNGAALEGLDFKGKGGNSYWVSATLTGEEANNFEFENGLQISDKTVYTVPQTKTEAFFNNVKQFVQNNMILVIGCAAGLLLLILLIIIIACAARSRKKKREREEQRRLEEKEERKREQEEREERRREEREERMARMSQQQMMMPQMMPQGMPQTGGQPMSMGGGYTGGGSVSEAQILQMQAELAELKAEKLAKEAAQQQIAQAKTDIQFAGFMAQLMGGGSLDKLTEIIRTEVRNALADEKSAAQPHDEHRAEEAKEAAPVCPPDAVMTTVTTTKIDTTKKSTQTAERAAAPAPAVRTVVRNVVAPMPVDDGRVFDVGGFYTPADPVTDEGSGEEDKH